MAVATESACPTTELEARPKGFEPLTFWLGADHTLTVTYLLGDEVLFCDLCGTRYSRRESGVTARGHARAHNVSVERAA